MTDPLDPQLLLETLEQVGDAVIVVGRDGRVRFANTSALAEFRSAAAELTGRTLPEALPELGEDTFQAVYDAAITTGRRHHLRLFVRAIDRWYDGAITPGERSVTVTFREVTDRVRRELRDRLRAELAQAVSDADAATLTQTLTVVARSIRRVVGYEFAEAWLVHDPATPATLLVTDHDDTAELAVFAAATAEASLPPTNHVMTAAAGAVPVITHDLGPGGFACATEAEAAGLRGAVFLPLELGEVRAVLGWLHAGDAAAHDRATVIASLHGHLTELLARETSRQDLDRVFRLSQDLIVVADLDGWFTRANPAWRGLGWEPEDLVGQRFDAFVHPDDLHATAAEVRELADGHPTSEFQNRFRTADGAYRTLRWTSTPVPEYGAMYCIARDVTQAEARRVYEATQRELLVAIALNDPLEDTLRRLAEMVEARLEHTVVTVLLVSADGRHLVDAAAPSVPAAFRTAVDGIAVGEIGSCGAAVSRRATTIAGDIATDPLWEPFRDIALAHGLRACWSVPFFDGVGQVLGTLAVYRGAPGTPQGEELQLVEDVAPLVGLAVMRARDEQQLREREQRFGLLARATSDAVWDWNLASDAVWWGDGVRTLFGYEPDELGGTGEGWLRRIHPDDCDDVVTAMAEAFADAAISSEVLEYRFRRRDDTYAHVSDRFHVVRDEAGRAVRALGGMTDLSERRELEAQYLRTQRMESLGALAGGIAHDLNNVLTPIVMAADLLDLTDLDTEQRDVVRTLGSCARRGADMVQQVLSFARGERPTEDSVDVRDLLTELQRMTREWFPKHLRFRTEVPDGIPAVRGDATQLQQVLINLALNARDAMPDGGELTVTAGEVTLERSSAELSLPPGRYVTLAVSDEGSGMPAEVVARLFDPFFTTKRAGTGLGLPTSRSIVHNHGGALQVTTDVDQGSTFTVWLVASERPPDPVEAVSPPPRGRGETLLIADDEAAVRAITRQALESYDYRVLTARDGAEAVSTFERSGDSIDLVLVDLAMPVLDGVATIRALRERSPQVRIVATTGLGTGSQTTEAAEAGVRAFLSKPYRSDDLLRTVRRALDGG